MNFLSIKNVLGRTAAEAPPPYSSQSHNNFVPPEQVQSNIDPSDHVDLKVNHILLTDGEEVTSEVIPVKILDPELKLQVNNKTYNV